MVKNKSLKYKDCQESLIESQWLNWEQTTILGDFSVKEKEKVIFLKQNDIKEFSLNIKYIRIYYMIYLYAGKNYIRNIKERGNTYMYS